MAALTYAQQLASFAAQLRYEELPATVVESIRLRVLDILGIALSNVTQPSAQAVQALVEEMGGKPEATVWGTALRAPAPLAALTNGTQAHGSDFDDTHGQSGVHPSVTIVPAILAVAEAVQASGRDAITAAAAGYEIVCRLGNAAPHRFTARGLHATPICGALAVAIASGKLLGQDASVIANAIGIAGSQGSGLLQFLQDGSWVKRLHPGWAAQAGIMAARLAQRGLTGPMAVLEGTQGLYRGLIAPEPYDLERLTNGLGEEWEVTRIIFKPYPCCHFAHAFIDAARAFRQTHATEEIRRIICHVPPAARTVVCEPADLKAAPTSSYAAQFSLPYCVSVALLTGTVANEHFRTDWLERPEVRELARRVSYELVHDGRFDLSYGGQLEVELVAGDVWTCTIPAPTGSTDRPMSRTDIALKFLANASPTVGEFRANAIMETVLGLDRLEDTTALGRLCQKQDHE